MKVLIFVGTLEKNGQSTSSKLSKYLESSLQKNGVETRIFSLTNSGIPAFDTTLARTPIAVEIMVNYFLEADAHIWISPLYHGSIPGTMKNCLDWLELSSKYTKPYLTDKIIGLISWADGVQALRAIDAMDSIAKSLRAWTLPFSIPIEKSELFSESDFEKITAKYLDKLDLMVELLSTKRICSVKQ